MAAGMECNSTLIIIESSNNGTDLKDEQAVGHAHLLLFIVTMNHHGQHTSH